MRILHVVYSLVPGQYRGGIPKIVEALGVAQAALGHEVEVFTTNTNSGLPVSVPLDRPVLHRGVSIRYFPVPRGPRIRSPALASALGLRASSFQVLHSHNTFLPLNRYVAVEAARRKIPAFYHTHGALDPIVLNRGLVKAIKKHMYIRMFELSNLNSAAGVFANTQQEQEQLVRLGVHAPIHKLPNGIGTPQALSEETLQEWRTCNVIPHDRRIIFFVGRFHPKKGLHLLVEAFAGLAERHPDVLLVLAGDRSQFPDYVRQLDDVAAALGLKDRIVWPGFMDETQKAIALATSTVFFHVSESEGMAMSVLEGMAAGLPVLVGRGCNMGAAVSDGAVLESEFTVAGVAACLDRLLQEGSLRETLGRCARAHVVSRHDWSRIAGECVEVYHRALLAAS